MAIPIYQVDAFTNTPFTGNPAAVCLLREPPADRWMQQVAAEMNLSETAFLLHENDGYRLRWFTPAVEVDLCGHATLAAAHVLWETGALAPDQQARFNTRSGALTADRRGDWIELDFPVKPECAIDVPARLSAALGVEPRYVGKSEFDLLVEVDSEATVRALEPQFSGLSLIDSRGIIVTSRAATPGYDFVSRCFYPQVGINEDPVTGSAHCVLAPFWSERLDKTEFRAAQVSVRGGVLLVQLLGDRVKLRGQAITVLRGELAQS